MVTRNRKFPTPPGYSRLRGRRETQRIVAEELETEEIEPLSTGGTEVDGQPLSRVMFDLAPPDMPRGGIDLRSVAHAATQPAAPSKMQRLLQAARRLGRRLFDWISWK
jgi:hypothetical protein